MCQWFYNLMAGILFIAWPIEINANFKYNVSLKQMATCHQYLIPNNRGYNYNDFFHVKNLNNNKLNEAELLHLKFYVMTAKNAHILLSVTDHPSLSDRVYEIVIGAGHNTFSTIRTSIGRHRAVTNEEANILSIFDPTPIEIIQMKDGNLLVYIPGYKEEPLMIFTDASPLNINYISFTTYDYIPARWFYDCQFDGFDSELKEEIRPLTPHQQLVANITVKAENASLPPDLTSVNFSFDIASIRYQHDLGFLQTHLNIILNWQDARLKWNPEDYDFINTLHYTDYDIWLPQLMIINTAHHVSNFYHEVKIQSNGSISLIYKNALLQTWCLDRLENWPNEYLKCDINFGLGTVPLPLICNDSLVHNTVSSLSEWHLHNISVTPIGKGITARFTHKSVIQSMDGDISIMFEISRNSLFYKNVFSIPILACQVLIILSFLLRGFRRGGLILVVILILMLGLMSLTKHAPTSYVPDIMWAYQHSIRISTFCYILHIVIIWLELYPPKCKPYSWLISTLNYSPLRLLSWVTRLADSDVSINIEQHPWKEIAKTLNAFCFLIVNLIFILTVVIY